MTLSTVSVTRRTALGLGAAATAGLLASCRGEQPGPGPTVTADQLPRTIPNEKMPYDLLPSDDGIVPGFLLSYPADPPRTVDETPGSGGEFVAACEVNTPLPVEMATNPVWQGINEQLGATLMINYTPGADWEAKQQSILAGGNLPDFLEVRATTARIPQMVTSTFADLSEFLAGDKIADYPNLAMNPQTSWRGIAFDGGIFGIPQSVPRYTGGPLKTRKDILDKLDLADAQPGNGDEVIELMQAVTDPRANRWASGVPSVDMFAQMLGAPNGWSSASGSLVHCFESQEYTQALEQVRQLWADGVYHPDAFAPTTFPATFDKGTTVMEYGAFDPGTRLTVGGTGNPDYNVGFVVLPKFDGGGPADSWTALGVRAYTVLKPDDPEKLQEKLRILNWIAAPTGTVEGSLTRYGIKDRNYTISSGTVQLNPDHKNELLILGYIAGAPVTYTATNDTMAEIYTDFSERLNEQYTTAVEDPTFGHYSATQSAEGATWSKRFEDDRNQVIQGNKPVSAWQDAVAEWRSTVGDRIAGEFAESLG